MAAATITPEVAPGHETSARPVHVNERMVADAGGRWDAIALAQSLSDKHAYLVQDDLDHWNLYLEGEIAEGPLGDDLEQRIVAWLIDRSRTSTVLRRADGSCDVLRAPRSAPGSATASGRRQ